MSFNEKEIVVNVGQFHLSKNRLEVIKALRVSSSIVVVVYDPESMLGGLAHMALPDSRMSQPGDEFPEKFVDIAIPTFLEGLVQRGLNKQIALFKIVGGSQLFNFGGGSGNLLNIGTRNAITARTVLNRLGCQVEKTETGGNKSRSIILDMRRGLVQVAFPGEMPRYI